MDTVLVHDVVADKLRKAREGKYRSEELRTKVHSIFARAVNLQVADELWTIAPHEMGRGPLAILFPSNEFSRWRQQLAPGDAVYLSERGPRGRGGILNWPGRLEPYVLPHPRIATEVSSLQQNLLFLEHTRKLYAPSARDNMGKVLKTMLDKFCQTMFDLLAMDDWASLTCHLCGGLGMGIGLTPSADDIVLGWTAVTCADGAPWKVNARQALDEVANAARETTTDVSAQMLKSASKGYYKQSIVELIQQIQEQSISAEHLAEVLNIGHSSGMDILRGIHLGFLSLLQRRSEWQ